MHREILCDKEPLAYVWFCVHVAIMLSHKILFPLCYLEIAVLQKPILTTPITVELVLTGHGMDPI